MELQELFKARRDTRHFTKDPVPEEVLLKALEAGHAAPSVGLTDATKYYLIRSTEIKEKVKLLFEEYDLKAVSKIENEEQKSLYQSLKLEAILDAPIGLVVCYDRSVLNNFTIGTIATNDTIKSSAVCAVQNIWLSLTDQGYSMGWVSILNYRQFKSLLGLPDDVEPLGYFCVGKPATDYNGQPMLQQLGWKDKTASPNITEIKSSACVEISNALDHISSKVLSSELRTELLSKVDNKTKPKGSLGKLENLAIQIAEVFHTAEPKIQNPHVIVFAADHGVAQHGVSAYPQEVTRQMVENFLDGGAAINVFCRENDLKLLIADAGVNYDFPPNAALIDTKVARGTQSFLHGPAMSLEELELCLKFGAEVVKELNLKGCNTVGFGEMGIGNTSSASVLMSVLCNIPLKDCVGKGTGVNDSQLERKYQLLMDALSNKPQSDDLKFDMAYFGGFEIMQIAGAILEAHRRSMLVVIDGFICTVAYLCAFKFNPELKRNAIFSHQSDEMGHRLLLNSLDAEPLLALGLRLGEGTGAALAFPLIRSAVAFLNDMASFESAGVSTKSL